MGEYTLDFITVTTISPSSYGRSSKKMKPSTFTMTIFGTFVQVSIPLEEEEEDIMIVATPINPKYYGKGYKLLQQMGYQGQGPLSNNGHALVELLSHTNG